MNNVKFKAKMKAINKAKRTPMEDQSKSALDIVQSVTI